MKLKSRIASLMLVGAVTVGLTVMEVGAADHHAEKDIVDTAVAAGSFKTLATALEAVLGAVYREAGLPGAARVIATLALW